jgi:hypothetical protein
MSLLTDARVTRTLPATPDRQQKYLMVLLEPQASAFIFR